MSGARFDPLDGCTVVGEVLVIPYDARFDPDSPKYVPPVYPRPRILDDDYPDLDGLDEWRERMIGGMR